MSAHPIPVDDADFPEQVLGSSAPVLVDFWAPWCGPCRAVAPVLDQLANELHGRLTIAKVNTDDNPVWATELGVMGIPTMILVKDGEEVDRVVGALPKHALVDWLEPHLGG